MTQAELNREVAAATGETVRTIADLGTDMNAWDPTLEADDAINHTALGLADPPNIVTSSVRRITTSLV